MTTTRADAPTTYDGFEVLDACHDQMLASLIKLRMLIQRLEHVGPDAEARALARDVGTFFAGAARQHHEDEERHVFPKLLATGDPDVQQAVLRLQQDHGWIEEDWLEIAPQLDAVAMGMSTYDLDELKAAVQVFAALSQEHIELEESLVYPEARSRLLPFEREEMSREMAARRRMANSHAGRRGGDLLH
ncbi:MAG TPA: hemerythrin domain-containing protein [Albitalea sp.]